MAKHKCIRSLPYTVRAEEAVGNGVTRCTSSRCVFHLIMTDLGVSYLYCTTERSQSGYERLAVDPTPQNDAADVCCLPSTYAKPIPDASCLIGRGRFESPRRTPPAFDHERNASASFYLLFHLVRGQLDRKCISGLYQRCEFDHHVQHER